MKCPHSRAPPGGRDHGRADVDRDQAEPAASQAIRELASFAADFQRGIALAESGGHDGEIRDLRPVTGRAAS